MTAHNPSASYNQSGFTMIELVAVIVILGLIGVTAASRFVDLRSDGVTSTLQAVEASLSEGSHQIHWMASMKGLTAVGGGMSIAIEGDNISLNSGYPSANWINAVRPMLNIDADAALSDTNFRCEDFAFCGRGTLAPGFAPGAGLTDGEVVIIWPRGYLVADECYAYYNNPNDGNQPNIGSVTSGC